MEVVTGCVCVFLFQTSDAHLTIKKKLRSFLSSLVFYTKNSTQIVNSNSSGWLKETKVVGGVYEGKGSFNSDLMVSLSPTHMKNMAL